MGLRLVGGSLVRVRLRCVVGVPRVRFANARKNDAVDPALRPEVHAGGATLGLDGALAPPLLAYLALLDRWNHTYNLPAIRDPRAMVALHLLDSLAMHPFVRDIGSLADLGSGAGLPGIPLAIAVPALRVTLVESNGKKARFLREAVRTLGLDNAQVAESRTEALARPGAFDAIPARATEIGRATWWERERESVYL